MHPLFFSRKTHQLRGLRVNDLRKEILLLWGDPKERQALFKILCATGADVHFTEPGGVEAPSLANPRLVVIDYDSLKEDANRILSSISQQHSKPAVLVITSSKDKEELINLFSHEVLTNLVAKNMDFSAAELIVNVQKIIRGDIFGFEKYLTWGVHPYEEVITTSDRKAGLLNQLEEYMNSIGINKRLVGLAKGVADEFFMNAVYNAPIDRQTGAIKYASQSRSDRVVLGPGEEVRFRYASDGRTLALSVEDNFGRLERSTVLNYLRKCFSRGDDQIDEKDGGAGLGLYYIFESLSNFVINVSPNKRTEMIGIIDISGNYRDFANKPKSLNIFLEESAS